jgi:DNA-directed RNA polymerase sigma subunit (sigma70/sigma32)
MLAMPVGPHPEHAVDPFADVEGEALLRTEVDHLRRLLATLSPAEKLVTEWRFGLGCDVRTVRDVARDLGIPPSGVRRLEQHSLERLRRGFEAGLSEAGAGRRCSAA